MQKSYDLLDRFLPGGQKAETMWNKKFMCDWIKLLIEEVYIFSLLSKVELEMVILFNGVSSIENYPKWTICEKQERMCRYL